MIVLVVGSAHMSLIKIEIMEAECGGACVPV